jgi:hypothetical protein
LPGREIERRKVELSRLVEQFGSEPGNEPIVRVLDAERLMRGIPVSPGSCASACCRRPDLSRDGFHSPSPCILFGVLRTDGTDPHVNYLTE